MKTSIGIMAYNEEANIGRLLSRLVKEPLINEIWVIADGCTDGTVMIVNKLIRTHNIRLMTRPRRLGKADAVNMFIKWAKGDILILESADTLPSQFCFKYLLEPFADASVGMVGAHPMPVNSKATMMGKVAHLLWEAHHYSALVHPKAGEVCAFRNEIEGIDPATPVDEAYVEREITRKGYRVVYAPKAVILNKGAETVEDFMSQRQRIYHGHLLLRQAGYEVPTMSTRNAIAATLRAAGGRLDTWLYTAWLEWKARRKAQHKFYVDGYKPTVWDMANTTKEL